MGTRGNTTRITAIAASIAAAALALTACSSSPGPTVTVTATVPGDVRVEGDTVVVDLTPTEPLNLRIDGVATLTAPAGVVKDNTQLKVETATGLPGGLPDGVIAAGDGVHVDVGTKLAKPITVAFDTPNAAPTPDAVPVAFHIADDGTWTAEPAKVVNGKITIKTRSFSIQIAGWAPSDIIDSLFDSIAGRTDAPSCPPNGKPGAPDWASMSKDTGSVHACLWANKDANTGEVRAEIFVKSNRGAYQVLRFPDGAQYTWMDDSTRLATLVARSNGLIQGNEILLPSGGQASAGYARPENDRSPGGYAKVTNTAIFASVLASLTDEFVLALAGACITNSQGMSWRSYRDIADLLDCALGAAGTLVDSPQAVKNKISQALGNNTSGIDMDAHANRLTRKLGNWKVWGKVLKAIGLAALIPKLGSMIGDAASDVNSGHSAITINLRAKPAPQPQPQPTTQAPQPQPKPTTQAPQPKPTTQAPNPGPAGVTITVNTCNTYGNCDAWNPNWAHSDPNVSSRVGDIWNGQTYTARCWTTGRTLTDGSNNTAEDDARQYTSNLWYGIDYNGGRAYVTSVWTTHRYDTLGLPQC